MDRIRWFEVVVIALAAIALVVSLGTYYGDRDNGVSLNTAWGVAKLQGDLQDLKAEVAEMEKRFVDGMVKKPKLVKRDNKTTAKRPRKGGN